MAPLDVFLSGPFRWIGVIVAFLPHARVAPRLGLGRRLGRGCWLSLRCWLRARRTRCFALAQSFGQIIHDVLLTLSQRLAIACPRPGYQVARLLRLNLVGSQHGMDVGVA
ncbi:hypothetical protein D3C76_1459200 [compost metagenome]